MPRPIGDNKIFDLHASQLSKQFSLILQISHLEGKFGLATFNINLCVHPKNSAINVGLFCCSVHCKFFNIKYYVHTYYLS